MPRTLHQHLMEKGWSSNEVDGALSRLYSEDNHPEAMKTHHQRFSNVHDLNPVIYWAVLIIAIIGNFIIALVFIPFLMMLTSVQILVILSVMGLIFGAMFNLLLKDIEKIDYKHHIVAGVFIPMMAAVTIFVVVSIANNLSRVIQLEIIQNPFLVTFVYVISFSAPYIIYKLKDISKEHKFKKSNPSLHTKYTQPAREQSDAHIAQGMYK
ncbi:hypothetical protein HN587_05795 [Candidatus Woesearchaeota archaeon]|jgi:hypothetical protein|nr:hypothetical protein [Candidatus Woesearchaeota archaeon]